MGSWAPGYPVGSHPNPYLCTVLVGREGARVFKSLPLPLSQISLFLISGEMGGVHWAPGLEGPSLSTLMSPGLLGGSHY